jgi:hypothetical protein
MDKKSLIGVSVCAVVLLVLGSLSTVVGYQSVKSTLNDSPLFQTRTQRATNQQQNILTSRYLGMTRGNPLHFPIKDNRTEQFKKAIDIISKMDDLTFERFTDVCIQQIKNDDSFQDKNLEKILQAFRQLRTTPDVMKSMVATEDNVIGYTGLFGGPSLCYWEPGCIVQVLLFEIVFLFYLIVLKQTYAVVCQTHFCQTNFLPCNGA